MNETRIVLDETLFDELVSGKIVETNGVKMILKDIGYLRMIEIIERKLEALVNKSV